VPDIVAVSPTLALVHLHVPFSKEIEEDAVVELAAAVFIVIVPLIVAEAVASLVGANIAKIE
jgi:hypothetical protein